VWVGLRPMVTEWSQAAWPRRDDVDASTEDAVASERFARHREGAVSGRRNLDPVDGHDPAGSGRVLLEDPTQREPGVLAEPVLVAGDAGLGGHATDHE
jgi:hypothetical protein